MRFEVPTIVVIVLFVAVTGGLVVGGATSTTVFDPYNHQWDGTSDLQEVAASEGAQPVVLEEATEYESYGDGDIAFVIAPGGTYSEADVARIREYVERGGTLVVAYREGAAGDELLQTVGADARPDGALLRDERNHYRSPALPVATETSNHSLVADVSSITLNHGTAVEANNATVLIASSPYAYLDRDGTGAPGDEPVGSYPVVTVEAVGDGQVIVVGDPSIFINVMLPQSDNEAFARGLVADRDRVLLDASHRGSSPPFVAAVSTLREDPMLQASIGVGAIVLTAAAGWFVGRRRTDVTDGTGFGRP